MPGEGNREALRERGPDGLGAWRGVWRRGAGPRLSLPWRVLPVKTHSCLPSIGTHQGLSG